MKRIERALSAIRAIKKGLGPARLLLAAAIFHAAVTGAVFGIGRYGLLPGTFNRDGIAVSFAPDGLKFQAAAAGLSDALRRGDFAGWAGAREPFHVKPYSVCFALFGGSNIVSAEPLNVLYYLLILVLVFELGREAFGRRAGLLAAAAVGLWPSLLLHTTQLLRDQLFLIGMLAYVLILQRWLTRSHSWRGALLRGAAGGLTAAVVWLARDNLAAIMLAAALLGAGLLVARQLLERRALPAALAGMALMLALTAGVMKVVPTYQKPDNPNHPRPGGEEEIKAALSETPWGRAVAYVAVTRHRFIRLYPDAGSNIDSDVQFDGLADVLRYAPRAAAVGFFAPFPDMWFSSGKTVGSAGRLLVGVESLLMYLVEALALCGLWGGRRRLSVWLLFLLSAVGMFALGLVVTNVGALYRIRYLFLILLLVLAAEGGARLLGRVRPAPGYDT